VTPRVARPLIPEWLRAAVRGVRLVARAGRLSREARGLRDAGALVDLVCRFPDFRPLQVRAEILALVQRVQALRPSRVCEIGPYLGGTSFLFARAAADDATIVLLDYAMDGARARALRRLGRPGQRVVCIRGDSHESATRGRIASSFGGALVDFLFIDGDHSAAGVAADWRDYAPLVRVGGIVAFHDVVADHRARFGRETSADSGGVPGFWMELKTRYGTAASELVENPDQDGCGIGIVTLGAGAPPPGSG
jgi:predicted O-methyltransferase YrrM